MEARPVSFQHLAVAAQAWAWFWELHGLGWAVPLEAPLTTFCPLTCRRVAVFHLEAELQLYSPPPRSQPAWQPILASALLRGWVDVRLYCCTLAECRGSCSHTPHTLENSLPPQHRPSLGPRRGPGKQDLCFGLHCSELHTYQQSMTELRGWHEPPLRAHSASSSPLRPLPSQSAQHLTTAVMLTRDDSGPLCVTAKAGNELTAREGGKRSRCTPAPGSRFPSQLLRCESVRPLSSGSGLFAQGWKAGSSPSHLGAEGSKAAGGPWGLWGRAACALPQQVVGMLTADPSRPKVALMGSSMYSGQTGGGKCRDRWQGAPPLTHHCSALTHPRVSTHTHIPGRLHRPHNYRGGAGAAR